MDNRPTNEKISEIVQKHYSDPVKRKVLDDFFREIMEIGDIEKTIITAHGNFRVIDGSWKPK